MEKLKQIFSVKSLHGVMNHLCICNDSTCNGFNSALSMDDLNAKTRHLIEKLSMKKGNGDEDSHVNPPLEAAVVLKTGKITRRGLLLINLSRMITDCKSPIYACKNHKQNLKGMEININSTS